MEQENTEKHGGSATSAKSGDTGGDKALNSDQYERLIERLAAENFTPAQIQTILAALRDCATARVEA